MVVEKEHSDTNKELLLPYVLVPGSGYSSRTLRVPTEILARNHRPLENKLWVPKNTMDNGSHLTLLIVTDNGLSFFFVRLKGSLISLLV